MKIYLASGNAHKVAEFQALAAATGVQARFISAKEIGGMPEVVEDTGTFVGNARKKARALWEKLGGKEWVLADDSGICVDALNGDPGVESAYFAGPQGDPAANLQKLLQVMTDVPDDRRGAHFLCLLLFIAPDGNEEIYEGRCNGRILREPRGGAGFGYDPVLVPEGFEKSLAELGDEVKNQLSHRGKAFRAWAYQRMISPR